MSLRTPVQIAKFIEENQFRMDLPQQFYGTEPNSYRKDWESSSLRACLFASWPYEQAAGNQSIPLVYMSINSHREDLMCDRSYLMATPRDMRLFEKHGIPVFGIESRHQLADFDVIGSSISYPVLTMNFMKQLMMSDIPLRWTVRDKDPERWPMVLAGGQTYGAPEPLSPIVDAFFCFSGATEIVTRQGVRSLQSLLGNTVEVSTSEGWCKADIKYFGEQEINRIEFAPAFSHPAGWRQVRSTKREVVEATPNHRWELVDGTVVNKLEPDMFVKANTADNFDDSSADFKQAWCHGFFFGDGYREYRRSSYRVRLHGSKSQYAARFEEFPEAFRVRTPEWAEGDSVVWTFAQEELFKELPVDPNAAYAAGFLAGWLAADGDQPSSGARVGRGSIRLSSQHPQAEVWLQRYAASAGWILRSSIFETAAPSNLSERRNPLYRYTLNRGSSAWKVIAISAAGRAPTYCAQVPGIQRFTLASGIYTHNCGEVEDEPGNPGIGVMMERIVDMKSAGLWSTERVECYKMLAREFNFLYFPRFIDIHYGYEDRPTVSEAIRAELDERDVKPSKQVTGYSSNLEGMRIPILKRVVKDMDKVKSLDAPPLLFINPGMGAGDAETQRGQITQREIVLIEGQGPARLEWFAGDIDHPHDSMLGNMRADVGGRLADVSHVLSQGVREVVRVRAKNGHGVDCTPDHEIQVIQGPLLPKFAKQGQNYLPPDERPEGALMFGPGQKLDALEAAPRVWKRADQLSENDILPTFYGQNVWSQDRQGLQSVRVSPQAAFHGIRFPVELDEDVAWLLGMMAGDCSVYSGKIPHVRWSSDDPGVDEKLTIVLERVFGKRVQPKRRDAERRTQEWEIASVPLRDWLEVNFGITDNKNRRQVPRAIFASPREVVASYLSGVFDSDGVCDARTGRPAIGNHHPELIRELSILMLNLGAPNSYWSQESDAHRVRFGDRYGPVTQWKLQGCAADDGDWSWLQPSHSVRRNRLRQWIENPPKAGTHRNGVGYYPIAGPAWEIEAEETYDLAVPELTCFTASGIVVHNCPAWCSFCALTYRQKPYRQRSIPYMVNFANNLVKNTGGVHIAPFGPDFPMHTQKKRLISALLENVTDEVDASSMRVDDFIADSEYILLSAHGGMDQVTLGVEGNSQRMRDLVGKGAADHDIKEAVARGIRAGIRRFKLYMICDLPGEDRGDIFRILNLAKELADIRDSMGQHTVKIQFSWTPLLIEANTPFQWFAPTASNRALGDVWEEFRDIKIDFKLGGKAQPLTSNVLTPSGWKRMGDLRVGDAVVDPDGYQSKVLEILPQGVTPTYRITFSDGSVCEAAADHMWDIERWSTRKSIHGGQEAFKIRETVTTERIHRALESSCYPPHLLDSCGLAGTDFISSGVEDLCLDPYLLGLLLGDGNLCSGTPKFFTADPQLEQAVRDLVPIHIESKSTLRPDGVTTELVLGAAETAPVVHMQGRYNRNPLIEMARALEVDKPAWEKFVPERYKQASAKTRLAVLQGLMDTDGEGREKRSAQFSSSSEQLRNDVVWLARSLGLPATAFEKPSYLYAPDGSRKECRTAYLADIWECLDLRVFRLSRKIKTLPKQALRTFKSIERIADVDCQCISVSAPSAQYITDDFIPTHNGERNKMAYFQLCQRASRDVGEAIVDVVEELGVGCWGGVPKGTYEKLEQSLKKRGFLNGFADTFDEREKRDMFGWEFIDQGINVELLWVTYQQMREFLENTDSESYDDFFGDDYHGNEWISRCDSKCYGKTCGVCDVDDLKLRRDYIQGAAEETNIDLMNVKVIDQKSVAMKVRCKVVTAADRRFVATDHWRYAVRRAAYRAGLPITKRTVRFVSDNIKFKDWTCGADFVEFGLTKRINKAQLREYIEAMNGQLEGMQITDHAPHPAASAALKQDVDLSLYTMEVDLDRYAAENKLREWFDTDYIPMVLKEESRRAGLVREEVNARDYVDAMWLVRDGHRLILKMLVRGKPSPYNVYAAFTGKTSWIEAAKYPAIREEAFIEQDDGVIDFFRPLCEACGRGIPVNPLDKPFDPSFCPKCFDINAGTVVSEDSVKVS